MSYHATIGFTEKVPTELRLGISSGGSWWK